MTNAFSNLFEKLKMANINRQLENQDQQNLQQAVNEAKGLGGNNQIQVATPEQAQTLSNQLQAINEANNFNPGEEQPQILPNPKNTLMQKLLGAKVETPTVAPTIDGDKIKMGTSNDMRIGGAIDDFASGYRENRLTPFNANNWGQQKNIATRIGEGFGSVGRFLDSPAGKMLLAYSASKMLGDTNPLEQAITAGVTNYNMKSQDRMYRDDLIRTQQNYLRNSAGWNDISDEEKAKVLQQMQNDYDMSKLKPEEQEKLYAQSVNDYIAKRQQGQLDDVANQINSQKGFLTGNMYNNYIRSQQLRDNADYRNMMLANQQEQNRLMNDFRREQAEYQRRRDAQERVDKLQERAERRADNAANRAVTMRGQDLSYSAKTDARDEKAQAKAKQASSTVNMINAALKTVDQNPNAFGIKGGLGAGVINRMDPKGVKARSVINSVTAEYRKYLTGAQMSDQERKEYYKFLPAPTDNAAIITSKLNSMAEVIGAREGLYSNQGDPLGIR